MKTNEIHIEFWASDPESLHKGNGSNVSEALVKYLYWFHSTNPQREMLGARHLHTASFPAKTILKQPIAYSSNPLEVPNQTNTSFCEKNKYILFIYCNIVILKKKKKKKKTDSKLPTPKKTTKTTDLPIISPLLVECQVDQLVILAARPSEDHPPLWSGFRMF